MERRCSCLLPKMVIGMLLDFWSKREPMSMPKVSNALTTTCSGLIFTIQVRMEGWRLRKPPNMVIGMLYELWSKMEPGTQYSGRGKVSFTL
jgi:hypothetical protein